MVTGVLGVPQGILGTLPLSESQLLPLRPAFRESSSTLFPTSHHSVAETDALILLETLKGTEETLRWDGRVTKGPFHGSRRKMMLGTQNTPEN